MTTVTAAITTYNRAALLVEALESVLAQTYADYEVIVVDNGSTDDTEQALEPYRSRIRYVRQGNSGPAGGRNRAIAEAAGGYIAFLDSDDRWKPDRLERQVPVLDSDPAVALVHGHVDVVREDGVLLPADTGRHRELFSAANRGRATYARYALDSRCFTSTVLARTDVLRALGGYDPAVAEDVDLYLRIVLEHDVIFLEGDALADYRLHGGQTGNDELARLLVHLSEKHLAWLAEHPEAPDARLAERNFHLQLARCQHSLGDGAAVRRATLAAARRDPRVLTWPRVARQLLLSFVPAEALRSIRARRAG